MSKEDEVSLFVILLSSILTVPNVVIAPLSSFPFLVAKKLLR
ncbi:hypothetical protein Lalb_Chr24g0400151 [Lupinus albus]|uniref:Uncharacterized protein n=1 Tax=Lupinus albus TaxID=3870 RepID=A0A6A4NC51_LUPAL|nr:hypothetical protein Lalb_Chr24g0400151 [Lupinus albus]